jgi:hypothetical protein
VLAADELAWVRSKVGTKTPPTDSDLHAIHDRVGTKEEVVREVLDTRLADLRNQPAQFSVPGEYSQDVSTNISETRQALKDVGGTIPSVTIAQPCNRRGR